MTLTSTRLSGRSQKQKRTDIATGLTPSTYRSWVGGGGREKMVRVRSS